MIVRAVPLSKILIVNCCPSIGVPERLVVNDVIFAAKAVIVKTSVVSVLIDGVADDTTVLTLLLNLVLFIAPVAVKSPVDVI